MLMKSRFQGHWRAVEIIKTYCHPCEGEDLFVLATYTLGKDNTKNYDNQTANRKNFGRYT